ncbi:hypothetical protein ABPG72_008245 [Tetrahymena utriculariae]
MMNIEQQNILSQDKNNSQSNKIQLTQNQLSSTQCDLLLTNQEEIKLTDQQQATQQRYDFQQSLKQIMNIEQYNILSSDKNNSQSNKIQLTQNKLSGTQCDLLVTNQEEIKLNDQQQATQQRYDFYQSDFTIQKRLKSKIFKQTQSMLFSNAVCQIINQEKKQSALISYSTNLCNPQELNIKSQQSQKFIQNQIISQKDSTAIPKTIQFKTSQSYIQQKLLESNEELSDQITTFYQDVLELLLKCLRNQIQNISSITLKIAIRNSHYSQRTSKQS